ncbi:2929_t:CDS:2, partial [Funneliformis caledonium]
PDLKKKFAKNLSLKNSYDLKDEKQENTASETKSGALIDTEFTSKLVANVEDDIENIADPIGEELATNALEYRRLLESDTLDPLQGTHILIVHKKFVRYGSSKEEKKMREDYPDAITFSAPDANTNTGAEKEWQVHIRLRNTVNAQDEAGIANVEQGFRMIMDTDATTTVIPYFIRRKLYNAQDGWSPNPSRADGYGASTKMFQASRDWYICL